MEEEVGVSTILNTLIKGKFLDVLLGLAVIVVFVAVACDKPTTTPTTLQN